MIGEIAANFGLNALGGINQYQTAKAAGKEQLKGISNATKETTSAYDKSIGYLDPYTDAGGKSLSQLFSGLQSGGDFNKTTTLSDIQVDPGYQFRLEQGVKALDRSAAAKGTLGAGGHMAAVTGYGQGLASQEYQSAWDRYQNNLNNRYTRLKNIADLGYGSSANSANLTTGYGENMANYALGKGNVKANIKKAKGSAIGGFLGSVKKLF